MRIIFFLSLGLFFSSMMNAQSLPADFLENFLKTKGSVQLLATPERPDTFRFQLIYTRITRK